MELAWDDDASLRRLAEERLLTKPIARVAHTNKDRLLHELLVHQTELEMQNEALCNALSALSDAHERLEVLFHRAPTGYVVLDAACRVTAANERAATMLGKTRRALLGARFTRFLAPDEAISFERYRREVMESATPLTAEFTMVVAGGEQRELRLESAAALGNGSEWYLSLSDVTAYNSMVRRLDHDERLRTVQRRRSAIAHSLNNFLYSIQGHAAIALQFIDPAAPAHAPLVQLQDVVQRCAAATQQLTAFSRSEEACPGVVDLNSVLSELRSLLPSLLGEDIDAEVHLGASDGAVRLSRAHVEQIFLTAVRNSRQAMPHGGSFRIETANVEAPEGNPHAANARFVRWTLSDTGVGMTSSTRDRAFEPFFTTKPPGAGTGLGLSLVKATVERCGGRVELESELGRGTQLIVHLPRATGTSSYPPPPDRETEQEEPFARVLLVEEDAEIASEAASRLVDAGCEVTCVESSAEAFESLREADESLNVLLIGQSYPDAVIEELVQAARDHAPWLEIVVAPLNALGQAANDEATEPLEDAIDLTLCAAVRATAR